MRCFTRGGFDWADRFPAIVEAASRIRAESFLIDGEAIVCGPDGRADIDAPRSRRRDRDVVLFAFDLLKPKGEDWRSRQLAERRKQLVSLLARTFGGLHFTEHLDACLRARLPQVCLFAGTGVRWLRGPQTFRRQP